MSKHAHLSFGLIAPVAALFLLSASGCGDDDGGGTKDAGTSGKGGGGGETAGSSSAGRGGSSAGTGGSTAGTGGATGSGTLTEGDQCANTPECGTGLTCVTAAVGQTPVRICARSCGTDSDCGKVDAGGKGTEICDSYTNLMRDAHCINLEPDAFADCGVGWTAQCDGDRACLYFPNSTIGVCADLCAVDPTMDAGIAGLATMCPNSLKCLSGVVESDAVGICGTQAARDAECGLEKGIICTGTDVCVPDDLMNEESPQHCREDCTETNMCTGGGACTAVRNLFRYCKK